MLNINFLHSVFRQNVLTTQALSFVEVANIASVDLYSLISVKMYDNMYIKYLN